MQSYSTLKSQGTGTTVLGLKPATHYIFQVRARTSAGCGKFSQAVEVETAKASETKTAEGDCNVCGMVGCWGQYC